MTRSGSSITVDGRQVPARCRVGGFELTLTEITAGEYSERDGLFHGVSGKARLHLPCARPPIYGPVMSHPDLVRVTHAVEVVEEVIYPQTQISLADAHRLRPDAQVGETLPLGLELDRPDLGAVIGRARGVPEWLVTFPHRKGFAVDFGDATIAVEGLSPISRIVEGLVTYRVPGPLHRPIEVTKDGFTVIISSLDITPAGAAATATVMLPGGLTETDSCRQASLDVGSIPMSPGCEFYLDAPDRTYGPWLLADTGLVIEGTGFVLDLSSTSSPAPWPPDSKCLRLGAGTASGEGTVPNPCNSGYLRGRYAYGHATVFSSGFFGTILLADPVSFDAINPLGQSFTFTEGGMDIWYSKIARGELRNGWTDLPELAVCEGAPGRRVRTPIPVVSVQPDLDLAGTVQHGDGEISWGELTRRSEEVVAWTARFDRGYVYLPAGPVASYSPVAGGVFDGPDINHTVDASLAQLESHQAAGVSFPSLSDAQLFSPDRPGGRANPVRIAQPYGWIRVGVTGVDGGLTTYHELPDEELGEPVSDGYVGGQPFKGRLFANDRKNLLAEFVTSASYDSHVGGEFTIPQPCNIAALPFTELKITSTGCLVGGDLVLPSAGVPLEYWALQLVPTATSGEAGVISVRTGRVLLTAAGIEEPEHFAKAFGLTWGELLADGDLGELFLDYNNWGQRFDGLHFNPREVTLSDYDPADKKPYLGVSGKVLFPFFGLHDVNIKDQTDLDVGPPRPRHVTVPKAPITANAPPTQLALTGTWHDVNSAELATFECLEADVDYNVAGQNGFFGTGGGVFGFLHSDPLDVLVEIHSDATDIRFTSEVAHDLDLGLAARLGGLGQIAGNARIEGPTLSRMTLYGMLEQSAAAGSIFGPKVGFETEVNISVTPTTFDFYASGDMLLSVALVDLEASATVHLAFDFAAGSAEGELYGRVDCDAVVAGLSGEGQLTWHASPAMQYLQGRLKVNVLARIGSAGLEGGFFIGNNVPKELAWVLEPTDSRFGVSRAILPASLTGVFGYGQASIGVNYYIVSGGVDIYAGAGAFSAPIAAGGPLAPFTGNPLLPYVVGACGVGVHGEILGGLVSASAWANLALRGPVPTYFEGTFGLRGCVAWVLCASTSVTAGINDSGFYIH